MVANYLNNRSCILSDEMGKWSQKSRRTRNGTVFCGSTWKF
jgi:hypothetical protein